MMAKKRNPTRQYVDTGMYTEQVADGTWQFVIQADGNYRTLCSGTGYDERRSALKGMLALARKFRRNSSVIFYIEQSIHGK